MNSKLSEALADRAQIFGGWVVGPTMLGPESFAQTGYDYVGFDVQHGYLDDADVALLLSRLEHVPIATAVRLPATAPAPPRATWPPSTSAPTTARSSPS